MLDLKYRWISVGEMAGTDREEDEAYLKAKEESMYGNYFPKGYGSVGLDLTNYENTFKLKWIDIGKGQVVIEIEINL